MVSKNGKKEMPVKSLKLRKMLRERMHVLVTEKNNEGTSFIDFFITPSTAYVSELVLETWTSRRSRILQAQLHPYRSHDPSQYYHV